ncbi:hypothetical protein KAFR_0J02630 [Kazachstania africana CBS 2517]|uniref:DUF866-domain-containing protein n=1 Tax=Kazachstania africana (strain ATCC 22294 / BCRC 22015 / CBS 2517 / CECT 1963 / NBRC 1671 / NRRL Y-8276) TaxID=1071382 RepID=H2B127_KAZAF|nr:hypothetical protein KAFR_0J02630 [Kazachstania africana CBS 2517]CCF60327.1 hypothetical protein KAFR_0J02630 [Kazachstania africana CBS 2517]
MLYLAISATLSENIKSVRVKDSVQEPAEYTFQISCNNCREVNPAPVLINSVEKHDMAGSKGEASFTMKCKFCSTECSVNLNHFEESLGAEPQISKDKRKKSGLAKLSTDSAAILQLDCRGCELTKFYFDNNLTFVVELVSGNKLECQFDQGENEWYDYDDDAGEEVSITDFACEFFKGK